MGTYPECDKYECEECPRQVAGECIDVESMTIESTVEDSFIDYIEQRFGDIERRLYALEKFQAGVERMIAKATQAYTNEEE